jgi:hypothetical protein
MKTLIIPGRGEISKDFKMSDHFRAWEFFTTEQGTREQLWNEFCELPETIRGVYFEQLVSLARRLDGIRYYYAKPVVITSGWRSRRVNKAVKGASRSYHLLGMAADIIVSGVPASHVQRDWDKQWMGGLGYGNGFTHLDTRMSKARFNY